MDKRTVVVAEDEASVRTFLALALRDEGYEVLPAPDGRTALELALASQPDCILLDLRMPRMDGIEFARRYRDLTAQPASLLVMSANEDGPSAAREMQADGFLGKPFELDSLLRELERCCHGSRIQKVS